MIRTIISMLFAFVCTHFVIAQQPDTSYLNRYDEQGNKHGQWVEEDGRDRYIKNYKHGKKDGIALTYFNMRLDGIIEYDNGDYKYLIALDDDGQLSYIFTDFVKVDTLLNAKNYAPNLHSGLRYKCICFHKNGVIRSESLEYLLDDGSPEIDFVQVGAEKFYNDKGELIEIIQHE